MRRNSSQMTLLDSDKSPPPPSSTSTMTYSSSSCLASSSCSEFIINRPQATLGNSRASLINGLLSNFDSNSIFAFHFPDEADDECSLTSTTTHWCPTTNKNSKASKKPCNPATAALEQKLQEKRAQQSRSSSSSKLYRDDQEDFRFSFLDSLEVEDVLAEDLKRLSSNSAPSLTLTKSPITCSPYSSPLKRKRGLNRSLQFATDLASLGLLHKP